MAGGRHTGPTWHGHGAGTRQHRHSAEQGVWIRDLELLPVAGLIVDPSALSPFHLPGLGLTRPRRDRTVAAPSPLLSRLALDISDPYALSLNYREHIDDVETPLAQVIFDEEHPAVWTAALARQRYVLLTVIDRAPLLPTATPQARTRALTSAWRGIIACGTDCVTQPRPPRSASCSRHHLSSEHRLPTHSPPRHTQDDIRSA